MSDNSAMISPAKSLDAVTANGNGATVDMLLPRENITMVVVTTGAPSAGTVTLQVSHDGVSWFATTATAAVTTSPNAATLAATAYRFARAVLSGLTGGTAPTVTASIVGSGT